MFGLGPVARAILMLCVALGLSAAGSALVRGIMSPMLLQAYAWRFSFVPGHYFGEHVAQLAKGSSNTCVVLGASTAREGFDPHVLAREVPGTRFVNAATTGGNNEVLEIQSTILEHFGIRPRCIIAGVSLWMMFKDGSPPLTGEEYLGLMDWSDVMGLASKPLGSRAAPRIAASLVFPLRSEALQLNRVVRISIWRARAATLGSIPLQRYEAFPGELVPANDYLYLNTKPHLLPDWQKLALARKPWNDASRYGGAVQRESLNRTIERLHRLSGHVVLVLMPQTSILDRASKLGGPFVRAVLENYRGDITTIDCSKLNALSLFVDDGHLNATGRAALSTEVGALLRDEVFGNEHARQSHCMVGAF